MHLKIKMPRKIVFTGNREIKMHKKTINLKLIELGIDVVML